MRLNAGIDPIIPILVGIGWFVIKALLNRRADAESWDESEQPPAPRPAPRIPQPTPAPARPSPVILAPQRRTSPAPAVQPAPIVRTTSPPRPMIISKPEGPTGGELAHLTQSQESYGRAAQLQQTVAQRLSAIDQQTTAHKPSVVRIRVRPPAAAQLLRAFRNPTTVRQAFLASFVLNPPKALE